MGLRNVSNPTERADQANSRMLLRVLSSIPGRARLRVAGLGRSPTLARQLEEGLDCEPAVTRASANPRTGALLLHFDPATDFGELVGKLEALVRTLVNQGATLREPRLPLSRTGNAHQETRAQRTASALYQDLERRAIGWRQSARMAPLYLRYRTGPALREVRSEGREILAQLRGALSSLELPSFTENWRSRSEEVPLGIDPSVTYKEQPANPWHAHHEREVLAFWNTEIESGLSADEITRRLSEYGPNALRQPPRRSELAIFFDQFINLPVALLGASAVLSVATGGIADAGVILGVVLLNSVIGYYTESNAEKTISALSRGLDPSATVLRAGDTHEIPGRELVPGDLVILTPGATVAADARILECERLSVDESSLTGESAPVTKRAGQVGSDKTPLAERENMVYRGTVVTGGSALAVVVATGPATEIGQIQSLVSVVRQPETPMQKQMNRMGTQMVVVSASVCAAVFGVGLLRGYSVLEMLQTAVSLAVAAVPEGLPTVAVTTLALGVQRMQEHKVLVRQISAIETLGSVQVICMDKTGTLTVNRMTGVALTAGMQRYEAREGHLFLNGSLVDQPLANPDIARLVEVAVLCNEVQIEEVNGASVLSGSPTESALVQLALDAGLDVRELRGRRPLVRTQYRTETRNYMTTLHEALEGRRFLAVKGRPADVLALCKWRLCSGELAELTTEEREQIESENECMAGDALRVLGIAYLDMGEQHEEDVQDMVWVGLVGMVDPPREGMRELMATFHRAGINTTMITGDQSATAHAIGKEIGVAREDKLEILDSTRIDDVDPEVLVQLAQHTDIFSRVSPAHKLRIVQALQDAGMVVAMTGDGVNDGPALKAADIGIAMGAGGTEVAREVAEIILQDDNLETMVTAVEQGRTIYNDIKKAVHFILSSNMSEILVTFSSVAFGLGNPLTPMQLLWINLLTDVFPELALAVQPPEADVLAEKPRNPKAPMFGRDEWQHITLEGSIMTAATMGSMLWGLRRYGPGPKAGTMAFMTLTSSQLLHAISSQSEHHSIFDSQRGERNKWIPLAIGGGLAAQAAAGLIPPLRRLLGSTPLAPVDWLVAGGAAAVPFFVNETLKLTRRTGEIESIPEQVPQLLLITGTPGSECDE